MDALSYRLNRDSDRRIGWHRLLRQGQQSWKCITERLWSSHWSIRVRGRWGPRWGCNIGIAPEAMKVRLSHMSLRNKRFAPNWAVKRTPTQAMPSAFSWPVLVPYAPAVFRRRSPW